MLKGLGGLGDMADMMKKPRKCRTRWRRCRTTCKTSWSPANPAPTVKATATAKGDLTALDIDPSIFNSDDKEVVEDLILAAIKDAQAKAAAKSQEELSKMTEGLGLPSGMKLPF